MSEIYKVRVPTLILQKHILKVGNLGYHDISFRIPLLLFNLIIEHRALRITKRCYPFFFPEYRYALRRLL